MSILDEIGLVINVTSVERAGATTGANLVANGDFPSGLTSWTQDTDSGNATIAHDATRDAAKITTNVGGDATGNISQDISVSGKGRFFVLEFESAMSGFYATMQGRFSLYDNTNTEWIIPIRNSWGVVEVGTTTVSGHYTKIYFKVKDTCASIKLRLYQNIDSDNGAGTDVWYDNVSIYERATVADQLAAPALQIENVQSYRQNIVAAGGFDSASIQLKVGAGDMADWLIHGLAHAIEVFDAGGNIVWEGFVNEVRAQFGATTLTVGPLTDMANRARILYKTMDWDTTPPVKGDSVKSVWFEQSSSVDKFGILEGTFSGGEGDVDEATQVIQNVVEETAWPEIAHNLGLSGGDITLNIECRGWHHMLSKYYYYRTGEAGKQNAYDKIWMVLQLDPNGIFDNSIAQVEQNTTQVAIYEDEDKTAAAVIKEIIDIGDSDLNRYVWGVYEGRVFIYEKQSTEVYYERSASDGAISIGGSEIKPWMVRPGRWVQITELIGGHITGIETMRSDPTKVFIESVSYTAPYGMTISGAKEGKFKQRLQRLGVLE